MMRWLSFVLSVVSILLVVGCSEPKYIADEERVVYSDKQFFPDDEFSKIPDYRGYDEGILARCMGDSAFQRDSLLQECQRVS